MNVFLLLAALLLAFALSMTSAASASAESGDASRGFAGDKISWARGGFANAQKQAVAEGKPLVVLVHKTWCGACKQLKKDFSAANNAGVNKLAELAKHYVMVNLEDDESEAPEVKDLLSPGGAAYIPRVVFFDRAGKLNANIKTTQNPTYPYFYPTAASLAAVMESALQQEFKAEL